MGVVTINLATGQTSVNGGNTETISSFENATGSQGGETLIGSAAANVLDGAGGNDSLDGAAGNDTLIGGAGNDTYFVDSASDKVLEAAGGGSDTVFASVNYALATGQAVEALRANAGTTGLSLSGNTIANTLAGNAGNDILDGKAGADTMLGGTGNDTYHVDNAGDVVDETGGDGIDKVVSSRSFSLEAGAQVVGTIENLTLAGSGNFSGLGNGLDNLITGNTGNNILNGGAGDDTLSGGDGSDRLTGAIGADRLTGGLDADLFIFQAINQSTVAGTGRDFIQDFSRAQGDRIDVSAIDANAGVSGNQAFSFISAAAFSGAAGELRAVAAGANTLVSGDIDGNAVADFSILVRGTISFAGGDFVL